MPEVMVTISTTEYKNLMEAQVRLELLRNAVSKDKYFSRGDAKLYLGLPDAEDDE